MTVQELIDCLQTIEDKQLKVEICANYEEGDWFDIKGMSIETPFKGYTILRLHYYKEEGMITTDSVKKVKQ